MRLLHCTRCHDVVRLYTAPRYCQCQRSSGYYITDTHVRLTGPARAIGIDTGEFDRRDGGTWHVSDRVERSG